MSYDDVCGCVRKAVSQPSARLQPLQSSLSIVTLYLIVQCAKLPAGNFPRDVTSTGEAPGNISACRQPNVAVLRPGKRYSLAILANDFGDSFVLAVVNSGKELPGTVARVVGTGNLQGQRAHALVVGFQLKFVANSRVYRVTSGAAGLTLFAVTVFFARYGEEQIVNTETR